MRRICNRRQRQRTGARCYWERSFATSYTGDDMIFPWLAQKRRPFRLICSLWAGQRIRSQKPGCPSPMSLRVDEPKPFQMREIVAQGTVSDSGVHLGPDTGKWPSSTSSKSLEDLPLPISKVMTHAKRSHIPAWQEPDTDRSSNLQELRLWVASTQAEFNDFLRASTPSFYQSTPIKDLGNQRVSGRDRCSCFRSSTFMPRGNPPELQISRRSS